MIDRAVQTVYHLAVDPVVETTSDEITCNILCILQNIKLL
jgi:hypothetical protein